METIRTCRRHFFSKKKLRGGLDSYSTISKGPSDNEAYEVDEKATNEELNSSSSSSSSSSQPEILERENEILKDVGLARKGPRDKAQAKGETHPRAKDPRGLLPFSTDEAGVVNEAYEKDTNEELNKVVNAVVDKIENLETENKSLKAVDHARKQAMSRLKTSIRELEDRIENLETENKSLKAVDLARRQAMSGQEASIRAFEEENCCVVCMDNKRTIFFYPCGHLVACDGCTTPLKTCPICRKGIEMKMTVYKT